MNDNDDLSARLRSSLDARGHAPELSTDVVTGASARTAPRLSNPARRWQVAGGATAMVAAVAVGALVVTSPFQQQGPLFTAAGSQGGGASAMRAEDAATSDMKIGWWVNYVYEAGSGLSTDGGRGSVYELKRVGTAEERLAEVADALGLDGTPRESQYSDPSYPTYVVGPEDGSAANATVSWSGTGNWYYSNPQANPPLDCEVMPIEGDGGTGASSSEGATAEQLDPSLNADDQVCEYVEPKLEDSLAPSEAEARSLAKAIFADTGLTVAEADIHVTVDAWQTVASANLTVDGVETALDWSVVWAATGELSWAYGHSVEAVDRGDYDTVSPAAAVERLADWRWFGSAGPKYQGGMNILAMDAARGSDTSVSTEPAPEAPVEEAPTAPSEEPSGEPSTEPGVEEPTAEPTVEPIPEPMPEPMPEPETVVVTVDSAEATLLLMWDSAGNAWLVPGYATQHPEGWYSSVVSLVEGVIELPAPVEIEPYLEENLRLED